MKLINFKKVILKTSLSLLVLFAIPFYVDAAKIFIDLPETPISVGNTSLIKVMINTETAEINATDGVLTFSSPKDIVSINIGGSIFDLWPRRPSLEGNKISFTGGTTAGVYGSTLRLFTIAVKPSSTNPIKINLQNATTYLNDGKGTSVNVSGTQIEIPVQNTSKTSDELASLISKDTTPPEKFKIELGQDPSVYDGKYFISFFTTDKESGIERYEIVEGDRPSVRSGNTYVLQDQGLSSLITIRAIDNAGNERVETFNPKSTGIPWIKIVIVVILILLTFGLVRFFRKK